jgi:hypothetical protein
MLASSGIRIIVYNLPRVCYMLPDLYELLFTYNTESNVGGNCQGIHITPCPTRKVGIMNFGLVVRRLGHRQKSFMNDIYKSLC